MQDWIATLFANRDLVRMGHAQRLEDLNLGMGWLYYGLTRLVRPRQVVVIGSWRGFAPIVFARGLADNVEGGRVVFIEPSLVDAHWADPRRVREHFARYDVANIDHHRVTTQQFVESEEYRELGEVGIVFIDGYHTAEQARFDYEAFAHLVPKNGLVLFHDSVESGTSILYGEERHYERTVRLFVDELKREPSLQVLDLPFCGGLTIVRRAGGQAVPNGT
jgi:predicted O-methyltransferase YrrM